MALLKKLRIIILFLLPDYYVNSQPLMESLNRGLVAINTEKGNFISWRLLASDADDMVFNVYRSAEGKEDVCLTEKPLSVTNFTDTLPGFEKKVTYYLKMAWGNNQHITEKVSVLSENYISMPMQCPENYRTGDGSVGDLDGDGDYELVIHMTGRGRDNAHVGFTSEPVLQAYEMDGSLLWEINLGKNIREGAHYTQFLVYDFDGDGKAEIVCKTADGTRDGTGNYIGNPDSVYVEPEGSEYNEYTKGGSVVSRKVTGMILRGPEYLSVFEGATGKVLATTDYIPSRHPEKMNPNGFELQEIWGDGHGNRNDRYLACVAYLDGNLPSIVMCRGYYTRSVLAAWNFRNNTLSHVWTFDSEDGTPGNKAYSGQGNHNLSVADVDNDGKDEIIYGACVIDDNGKGLYSTGFGHGDAIHVSDLDPENPGLEVFNIQERFDDAGMNFREAGSGKVLWKMASVKADEEGGDKGEGPGRAASFNIDPRYPGNECWVFGAELNGIYSAKGVKIGEIKPRSCNFAVWWDGDLQREILDKNYIGKWNWETEKIDTILLADECRSNNGTKGTPVLSADLFGDWREEVIWRTNDGDEIRIYTTTDPTEYSFYTLMHDPVYRLGIAWQNVAYNQPPHTSYYIGNDMIKPEKPNIRFLKKD